MKQGVIISDHEMAKLKCLLGGSVQRWEPRGPSWLCVRAHVGPLRLMLLVQHRDYPHCSKCPSLTRNDMASLCSGTGTGEGGINHTDPPCSLATPVSPRFDPAAQLLENPSPGAWECVQKDDRENG